MARWKCGSLPHERQLTDVRCYATACWFHLHGNHQYVTTQQYCNAITSGVFSWSVHTQQSVAMQRMTQLWSNQSGLREARYPDLLVDWLSAARRTPTPTPELCITQSVNCMYILIPLQTILTTDWQMTDPTSRQGGRPKLDRTVTFKEKKNNIWSKVPDWARHQDILTEWPSVVK
jgi:hypothetical protein